MIRVAVGVVRGPDGRVLLAQRPPGGHLAGLWEFPGGKFEPGERRIDALERELREEVGIAVTRAAPLIRIIYHYPERSVDLDVWEVTEWKGDVRSAEGQPIAWVRVDELEQRPMPPADRPIIRAITLPAQYLVTPEPDLEMPQRYLDQLERCLGRGLRLVQVRVKAPVDVGTPEARRLVQLLRDASALARQAGAELLLNVPPAFEEAVGTVGGLHLSASRLASLHQRPRAALVGASCHNATELEYAVRHGLDFAVLGAVKPTATHPGADVLGWEGFEALVSRAQLPVFALGGMGLQDLEEARARGAQGIAAIRSLWSIGA